MVPAPLLRVVEGTTLVVSVRNDLTSPLRVHGLCARDGGACAPLDVPPGADREVRFASGRAGTYHYWATSMGAPIPFREMGGAFVVDPAGVPVEPDRIFVITEWSDLTPAQLREIMASDDSSARFLAANPKVTLHDQRAVVAVDRAAHLPPRRSGALARHQPQLADPPDAPARVLLPRAAARRRRARRDRRRRRGPPRRHADGAVERHADHGVGAGAGGQLAVPLPRHGPRRARATARRVALG